MRYFNKMTRKNIKIIDDTVITNNINDLNDINNFNNAKTNQNVKTKATNKKITKKYISKKNKTISLIDNQPLANNPNNPNNPNNSDNLNILNNLDNLNIIDDIRTTGQICDIINIQTHEQNNNIVKQSTKTKECTEPPKKSNDFLKELLLKQLPNINPTKKLTYNDIRRISKFLVMSIFDEHNCSIWNGYITNEKNQTKGTYINFYFNQKKIALHRLLYLNFIGDILNTEYIKFSCANKGKCCNIHHMKKYSYNSGLVPANVEEHHVDNSVHIVQNKNDLVIEL